MNRFKRQPLQATEREAAAASAPRTTVEKLFVLQAVLADQGTTKTDCLVLAVLVEAQNKSRGYSWPAIGTIAATAGITPRAVQKAVARLEQRDYIMVDPGGAGPNSSNRYFIRPVTPRISHRGVNERAPLSLRARIEGSAKKGEGIETNDAELEQRRANSCSPDPSYESTDNQNNSAPAALARNCTREAYVTGEQDILDSSVASVGSDPLSSLPNNPSAFLARVERRFKQGPFPNRADADAWLAEVESLASGDPSSATGRRAKRLYEEFSDDLDRREFRRESVIKLRNDG